MELVSEGPAGGLPVVEGYGDGGFRVDGAWYAGPVLVLPAGAEAWPVTGPAALDAAAVSPVLAGGDVDLLVVGTGGMPHPLPQAAGDALRAAGIAVEAMPTPAAVRTHAVLAAEGRRVAAALLPV